MCPTHAPAVPVMSCGLRFAALRSVPCKELEQGRYVSENSTSPIFSTCACMSHVKSAHMHVTRVCHMSMDEHA